MYLGCFIETWIVHSEPTSSDLFCSRSRNVQKLYFRKPGKLMGIAPQTIPIPKWGIFLTTLVNSIARRQKPSRIWWPKLTLTWWQAVQKGFVTILTRWHQLKKKFPTAHLLLRQAKRRRHVPQVNLNSAVRIPLRTFEADQILLALQQLATNFNSANFNNNISRFSKLPKSLTTTMPTFDGKSEKFELFEDLFQTSLKIHNQLTEEDKINHFHSHAWWCSTNFQKHH